MKARRLLFVLLTLVLVIVGASGLWVWRAKRQYALNRELIAALLTHDHKAALSLVNRGADPNTRQEATPVPTLPQLCRQLLHRSASVVNDSSTAFQIACGDVVDYYVSDNVTAPLPPEDVPLVQAMLTHGADIRATDKYNYTALFRAIICEHPHVAQLLLDSGANVNALEKYDVTPLMFAVIGKDVDTVRRLLEHGASVTPKNMNGDTALHCAIIANADIRMIRLLLAHGADPNALDVPGTTPLHIAQQQHRPDLVRLLRRKR